MDELIKMENLCRDPIIQSYIALSSIKKQITQYKLIPKSHLTEEEENTNCQTIKDSISKCKYMNRDEEMRRKNWIVSFTAMAIQALHLSWMEDTNAEDTMQTTKIQITEVAILLVIPSDDLSTLSSSFIVVTVKGRSELDVSMFIR